MFESNRVDKSFILRAFWDAIDDLGRSNDKYV